MSESILEQLAVWHLAAINSITEVHGYQQTIVAKRPEEVFIDSDTVTDLTAICEMGECVEDVEPTLDQVFWRQTFHAWVYLLGVAGTSLAVDTRVPA
jgi:hypothetical protein